MGNWASNSSHVLPITGARRSYNCQGRTKRSSIHQVGGEGNIGINHIAFTVDNAQAAYDELRAQGVPMPMTPNFVPATGRTTVNFRDPDGWRLQLVDAERKPPP